MINQIIMGEVSTSLIKTEARGLDTELWNIEEEIVSTTLKRKQIKLEWHNWKTKTGRCKIKKTVYILYRKVS